MHKLFVTSVPTHLRGCAGDIGANGWDSNVLSSSAVPDEYRASDITQITPRGIYYNKEQGYDSQQVPVVQGF